ncbi:MAG: chromate resistance protein ChrB domain-containing protein [Marmoricola sp.]
MKWATRASIHIDRAASAWLIRRFIDAEAAFVFVTDPGAVPADAVPFDMRGVEFGHHGHDCTFETLLRRHDLDDPLLWRIAQIIHEADLADERFDAPEAPGLDVVLRGLSMVCNDDHESLAITRPIFDGLYEFFRRELLLGREPS